VDTHWKKKKDILEELMRTIMVKKMVILISKSLLYLTNRISKLCCKSKIRNQHY